MTRLGDIIDGLAGSAGALPIDGVAIDHRQVGPNSLFGAFKGSRFDAEAVIPQAIAAGAVAIVARPEAIVDGAVHIAVDEPRRAFALAAARWFARAPSTLVAVTGTNGKTSTVELLRQIWQRQGQSAASIGTLGITTADGAVQTGLTTPDIVTFLSNLSGLAAEGVTHCAFEASSHGLDQFRTEGPCVVAGAFTNLSRDHLDYHADMDSYFLAKMRLFDEVVATDGAAVIWADDPWSGKAIAHAQTRGLRMLTVGLAGEAIRLLDRTPTALGQTLRLSVSGAHPIELNLPLIGAYQAANALVAAGLALATGCPTDAVVDALQRLQPVRGRLERATVTRSGVPVYVDYAHTPDAVTAALSALRPHTARHLICVVGAGGDRDSGKRAPMGAEAARGADLVIVTDDNPRSEDPALIRRSILAGAPAALEFGDRRAAIAEAVRQSVAGDMIVIVGKGHEQGQIVGAGAAMRVLPFDDAAVARDVAAA